MSGLEQRSKATLRQRRLRARQSREEWVAPVPVTPAVIDVLLDLGWLAEHESEDRGDIGQAIGAMLADLALHHHKA